MRTITFLLLLKTSLGFGQVTITPNTFEITESITISIDANSSATDCNGFNNPTKVYLHSGVGTEANAFETSVVGHWGLDDGVGEMTLNASSNRWEITFIPKTYYNLTNEEAESVSKIGLVFRNETGAQEMKENGCNDFIFNIGSFQLTLNAPLNSINVLDLGQNLSINADASLISNFTLKANKVIIDQQKNKTNYNFSPTISENTTFTLDATNNGETKTTSFQVIIKPTVIEAEVPSDMKDGFNLNISDNTKATLVFYAPNKEFIHVIGSFNNWQIDNAFLLNKDSAKNRFWIELTGLLPQIDYTYQYLIDANLRVADPYSTVVLTENNDQYIDDITYPNLPNYPLEKTKHAVTLLRTGDALYVWKTTNFQKPAKTDLVIYELLIRDFDQLHSFDAVKARLNYLQELGVNAIEFMPVNEFDGNESWGYNPSFHMALDKYYGNINSFKQLIDECHKRGIAVILDVVYNHASGQHPYYRMWNTDNGGYGGQASSNSPFFNQTATHSYSVFNDFNHSKQATKDYVKRVSQYWIDTFKIDGFRWDLTKGFTQNCTENDEDCTGNYQADRVAILKEYADFQWERNLNFYVIFEHLGGNTEELQWVNYRLNEGKGIMMWGNQNYNYRQATSGSTNQSNFSTVSYKDRNWPVPANISYMESHDEERLMVESLTAGQSSNSYNIKNLSIALERQELAATFYFTIPGPKMIWQFGELGYDFSINYNGRTGNKPIRWNYLENQNRKNLYNTWSALIQLKLKYDIFKTSNFTIDASNQNGLKKIQLTDATASKIQYINIIGNFGVTTQNINPTFQKTGTWYNLLNNNEITSVTNTNNLVSLAPGAFRVYGNKPASLSTNNLFLNDVMVYPNPIKTFFRINMITKRVIIFDVNGKRIREFLGDFNPHTRFSIKSLKKGFYFLEANNEKGKIYQKLIIE